MKTITNDIFYVGVNDHKVDLFEGQYIVPNGMAYNSYVIKDGQSAVFDTVEADFGHEWLDHISEVLGSAAPDYLIVQHMEPDHAGNIKTFMKTYPTTKIVGNAKTFTMIGQFFGETYEDRRVVVKNGDTLTIGKHTLTFVFAPMVHWPEVMVTYDSYDKVLFSADAFGKFGALDVDEEWDCEARRYYFGIVGKYGPQAQNLLKAAAGLDIQIICATHGPILKENLEHYIGLYQKWTTYEPESEGVVIAYTSVYGNTKKAVEQLVQMLKDRGCPKVSVHDLARMDMAEAVEDAFRYNKLVLATTTYNAEIFPYMREFINHLTERNFQKRTVGLIENGTWAPMAAKVMYGMLEKCKNIDYAGTVTIKSALNDASRKELTDLADELCQNYIAEAPEANKNDMNALFKIGYGLYVVTSNDGKKDNGLIVNTVTQLTSEPNRVAVAINKANYSHYTIQQTGYIDMGTHGLFICAVTEARVISDKDTMTYTYYQSNVKPKPETEGKKGFVCKICGYIYEGDTLPDDFICPLCKHGAADFEPIS